MFPTTLPAAGLLAAALLLALPAAAQDVQAGRHRAQACMVCHGPVGLSSAPDAPHLAGQPALYLAAQLRAYRSGARRHEVMNVIARGLTDDDIAALSAWYSAIRVEAQPPQ
ncbi:MAG: c-type cytochrome [Betaproteobacteria bacterium]